MVRQLSSKSSPWAVGLNAVKFTVAAEVTNVIKVTVETKGAAGRLALDAYFSDDANGDSVIATAPSGTVVIATNGVLVDVVAKKVFKLITEANGLVDINITEAGAKTMYLVVVMPNGTLQVSPAITFAA